MTDRRLTYCTHCGHNLEAERPTSIGPLAFDPLGMASWRGAPFHLTAGEHLLLGGLVQARGGLVRDSVLAERIGTESLGNVIQVLMTRLRRKFRDAGAPATLIQTVRHRGYRLDVAMLEEAGDAGAMTISGD
ncbi:helix-turn-helix domain-containing protein [Sphingosinicella sp. CPCC 101087]|uniref:helix-turn-helix domain-containing protein n=1 Tax=Sphingosinicella sp. CPCC 101087 TaxID=2497754 RepID=UPI00101DC305|nr:helix-turn-helix domain-containing protein [Sphingosinicella sp. CPCC 101087]